ncbi:MAG: PEP-CTERM sorting domain-containing protein [Verrucomicrobiales bacterium]|jgi:hypothetical protein|nr:PEP-CTERM sorting domain-containing protein [Verrucomicrobiales bacterium]
MITNKTVKLRRNAMKTLKLLVLAGALSITSLTHAVLIEGSLGVVPNNIINLNDYDAFAFYGVIGKGSTYQIISGDATTDANNVGQFSNPQIQNSGTSFFCGTLAFYPGISYNNAVSTIGTPTQNNATETSEALYINQCNDGVSFTLTTTLFASEETISFYLINYNARSNFSAVLSRNNTEICHYSLANQILPTTSNGNGTGDGNTSGILTLTVSGEIGDLLTFTNQTEYAGVSNTQFGNVGIAAVTALAIPEPGTWALIVVGLGTLIGCRCFRK